MSSNVKVHFDASKAGDVLSTTWCGLLGYETSEDESRVTCRRCRAMRLTKAEPAVPRAPKPKEEKESALDRVIRTLLKPKADAPPVLTAQEFEEQKGTVWENSCRGGEEGKCKQFGRDPCAICRWEMQAGIWEHAAPDRFESERIRPDPGAVRPRWPSLAGALIDLVEFERHDRFAPSAMGGLLARIERGSDSDGGMSRPDDPMLHKAGELVVLRSVLERAYPEGAHATLPAHQCRALLVIRTKGVLALRPTYEEISELLKLPVGELRALVRRGADVVTLDLFERGLIPKPRMGSRRAREEGSRCLAATAE